MREYILEPLGKVNGSDGASLLQFEILTEGHEATGIIQTTLRRFRGDKYETHYEFLGMIYTEWANVINAYKSTLRESNEENTKVAVSC